MGADLNILKSFMYNDLKRDVGVHASKKHKLGRLNGLKETFVFWHVMVGKGLYF